MTVSKIELPSLSVLDELLKSSVHKPASTQLPHLLDLAQTIIYNLENENNWRVLNIHTTSSVTGLPLPRPLISGLPPKRIYVHPDEQVEILKAEHKTGTPIVQHAEREWVLPTHLSEKWSLRRFAEVFDSIEAVPDGKEDLDEDGKEEELNEVGKHWRGMTRQKRVLLATLHDDSTVVYYIMHDGIVKPRQN